MFARAKVTTNTEEPVRAMLLDCSQSFRLSTFTLKVKSTIQKTFCAKMQML